MSKELTPEYKGAKHLVRAAELLWTDPDVQFVAIRGLLNSKAKRQVVGARYKGIKPADAVTTVLPELQEAHKAVQKLWPEKGYRNLVLGDALSRATREPGQSTSVHVDDNTTEYFAGFTLSIGLGRPGTDAEWAIQRPHPDTFRNTQGLFNRMAYVRLLGRTKDQRPEYEVTQGYGDGILFAQPGTLHAVTASLGREAVLFDGRATFVPPR